jgi:hypothetical protein
VPISQSFQTGTETLEILYADSMRKLHLIAAIALVFVTLTVGPNLVFAFDPVPGCCKAKTQATDKPPSASDIFMILRSLGII